MAVGCADQEQPTIKGAVQRKLHVLTKNIQPSRTREGRASEVAGIAPRRPLGEIVGHARVDPQALEVEPWLDPGNQRADRVVCVRLQAELGRGEAGTSTRRLGSSLKTPSARTTVALWMPDNANT